MTGDSIRIAIADLLDNLDRYTDARQLLEAGGLITTRLEQMPLNERAQYEGEMRRLIAALESHIFTLEQQLKEQQT